MRGEVAPGAGTKIPVQPMEKRLVEQVVPLQPTEDHAGADIHTAAHGGPHSTAKGNALMEAAAHGKPTQEQAPGRSCGLWREVHTGAGLLTGPVPCGGLTLEQSVPRRTVPGGKE